jgi:Ca2+-binding EF-hand superfamily protein
MEISFCPVKSLELDLLFRKFDRNGDGVVSFPEFLDSVLKIKEQTSPLVVPQPSVTAAASSLPPLLAGASRFTVDPFEVDEIVGRLRKAVESKPQGAIMDAFTTHAVDGRLTKVGFASATQQLGYKLLSYECDAVFDRLAGREGSVLLRDAVQFVQPVVRAESTVDTAAEELVRVLELTRARMKTSTSQAVETVFRSIDSNGSGNLSRTELDTALRKLGVALLPGELDKLFKHFDKNEDGVVSLQEFLRAMGVIMMVTAQPSVPSTSAPAATVPAAGPTSAVVGSSSGGKWWKQVDKPKLDLESSTAIADVPLSLTSLLSGQPDSAAKRFHEVDSFLAAESDAKARSGDLSQFERSVSFDDEVQRMEHAVWYSVLDSVCV